VKTYSPGGSTIYRRPLPTSHVSRQQTETPIHHSRRPRGQLLRHALRRPCIRCGGRKGMEPAAGAFTGIRDSWPLQDGIKYLSLLHPVTVANCLTRHALVMTLFILWRVRNCQCHYCCYYYQSHCSLWCCLTLSYKHNKKNYYIFKLWKRSPSCTSSEYHYSYTVYHFQMQKNRQPFRIRHVVYTLLLTAVALATIGEYLTSISHCR